MQADHLIGHTLSNYNTTIILCGVSGLDKISSDYRLLVRGINYDSDPLRVSASTLRYRAVQRQKAVTAYFTSKQLLPFGFAKPYINAILMISPSDTTASRCLFATCAHAYLY